RRRALGAHTRPRRAWDLHRRDGSSAGNAGSALPRGHRRGAGSAVSKRGHVLQRRRSLVMSVLRLARWEWFKLRRRWMPWILLALALLFSQLSIWGSMIQYRGIESGGAVFVGAPGGSNGPPQTVECS